MVFPDGWGFHYTSGRVHYLNSLPKDDDLLVLIKSLATQASLHCGDLGPDVRTQRIGPYRLAVNYGSTAVDIVDLLGAAFDLSADTRLSVGKRTLVPAEVAVWVVNSSGLL
jgi:hypothetical protein